MSLAAATRIGHTPGVTKREACDWFRELREERGLRQEDLAIKLGYSVKTIQRMEDPTARWVDGGVVMTFLEAMDVLKLPNDQTEAPDQDELLLQASRLLRTIQRKRREE